MILTLCILGVATATLLLLTRADRPTDREADEAPYYAPVRTGLVRARRSSARVRGAVDLTTGHTAFEVAGTPTPEQNAAIATIVGAARHAAR